MINPCKSRYREQTDIFSCICNHHGILLTLNTVGHMFVYNDGFSMAMTRGFIFYFTARSTLLGVEYILEPQACVTSSFLVNTVMANTQWSLNTPELVLLVRPRRMLCWICPTVQCLNNLAHFLRCLVTSSCLCVCMFKPEKMTSILKITRIQFVRYLFVIKGLKPKQNTSHHLCLPIYVLVM